MHQMAMMLPLDTALKAKGDEETNRYRDEVEEKITPTVYRFMRCMDIEHWRCSPFVIDIA